MEDANHRRPCQENPNAHRVAAQAFGVLGKSVIGDGCSGPRTMAYAKAQAGRDLRRKGVGTIVAAATLSARARPGLAKAIRPLPSEKAVQAQEKNRLR
jgi:hypothetical protein